MEEGMAIPVQVVSVSRRGGTEHFTLPCLKGGEQSRAYKAMSTAYYQVFIQSNVMMDGRTDGWMDGHGHGHGHGHGKKKSAHKTLALEMSPKTSLRLQTENNPT